VREFGESAFSPAWPGDFADVRVVATTDPETYVITLGPEVDDLVPAVYHRAHDHDRAGRWHGG